MTPRLISGPEAAAYCGISSATFAKWVHDRIVPPAVEGTRRWDRKAIEHAMNRIDVRPAFPTMSEVYFIESGCGDFIKIGFAGSAKLRLKELQASNPTKLKILATIPGSRVEEERVHALFADIRHHGEWFAKSAGLLAYIDWLGARG